MTKAQNALENALIFFIKELRFLCDAISSLGQAKSIKVTPPVQFTNHMDAKVEKQVNRVG